MPCVLTILLIEGLDDYTVNDKGNIVFVQKTTEETDKLIAIGNNNIMMKEVLLILFLFWIKVY